MLYPIIYNRTMELYYRPLLQSPQTQLSLLLNGKSKLNGKSFSASMDKQPSSKLDTHISFRHDRRGKNLSLMSTIASSSKRDSLTDRITRTEEVKRQYLNKVLINRMINVRLAFKLIEQLPIHLLKQGPSLQIAKSLILKTKLNLQTSMLRTLLYASENKQPPNKKLKYDRGQNLFVLPANPKTDLSRQEKALLQLVELVKIPLKEAVKRFAYQLKKKKALSVLFNKICSLATVCKNVAFVNIKIIANHRTTQTGIAKEGQLKIMGFILKQQCLLKTKEAFSQLKIFATVLKLQQIHTAKNIVTFSKLRKEILFKQWIEISKKQRQQQLEQNYIQNHQIQALHRIVKKNFLRALKDIARKMATFRKAAIRIGAYTKINQQKSLWRLLVNAQRSQKQ